MKTYVMENLLENSERYKEEIQDLFNLILEGTEITRNDECKVKFPDGSKIKMKESEFLVNMILWTPYAHYPKHTLTKEAVFDCSQLSSDTLFSYFDDLIDLFITKDNSFELNLIIGWMLETLGKISYYFNPIIGNTISIHNFIKLAEKNKEFDDIIHTKFTKEDSSYDVEKVLKDRLQRLIHILGTEENALKDYINAKEGINSLQLSQFAINIGNKPSLSGQTIPIPVNSNFLRGLDSPSQYYIDAISGRKAQIINNTSLKQSGYLNRKLSILTIGVNDAFDVEDCGTPNYLEIEITDQELLKRFHNRTMIVKCNKDGSNQKLKRINAKKDLDLIGQVIKVRSPITCCCEHGICRTCYGKKLTYINSEIHIGLLATMEMTSRVSQMLISAKHLLNTTSEKVDWDPNLLKYFTVENNAVLLNISHNGSFDIKIDSKQLFDIDEESLETGIDTEEMESKHFIKEFSVIVKNEEFKIHSEKELYLSNYFEELLNSKGVKEDSSVIVNSKKISTDEILFYVEIANEELSSHLKNIFSIIESKDKMGITDYNELMTKFNQFLIRGKINIQSIHPEVIVHSLIRRPDNLSRRPDFTQPNPEYTILRVSDAILNSGSLIERIAFEKLKNQFSNPSIYTNIWRSSLFDNLFDNNIRLNEKD